MNRALGYPHAVLRRRKRAKPRGTTGFGDKALIRMIPMLDASIEKHPDDHEKLVHCHKARALARWAQGDVAGALEDADRTLALGPANPGDERAMTVVQASAVVKLSLASRYDEALDRLTEQPTTGLDVSNAQHMRLTRAELLMRLGRAEEARAVLRETPIEVHPDQPRYAAALVGRAHLRLEIGDVAGALTDVDTALAHGVDDDDVGKTANLGAYCIAVLGLHDRLAEAQAWSDLACSPGLGGRQPGIAERETQAAVRTMAGRGAEAIPTLEEGLGFLERAGRSGVEMGWSHMFLARAHLDAGNTAEARRHAEAALERQAVSPVLDDVLARLDRAPD